MDKTLFIQVLCFSFPYHGNDPDLVAHHKLSCMLQLPWPGYLYYTASLLFPYSIPPLFHRFFSKSHLLSTSHHGCHRRNRAVG
jgi:hypothetical protein